MFYAHLILGICVVVVGFCNGITKILFENVHKGSLVMKTNATSKNAEAIGYWSEETSDGKARFRARIGGLHCSLCTGTIERAVARNDGVDAVSVSLTHEQALVDYDPTKISADDIVETLRDIGYHISDPRKLRPYEKEEEDLVKEGRRLVMAIGASLLTISLIASLSNRIQLAIPVLVGGFLLAASWLVLRGQGRASAIKGTVIEAVFALAGLTANYFGLVKGVLPYIIVFLALVVVFGLARHILNMAVQSLRRGILNQHVMLEAGAFAGLIGGAIGLVVRIHGYPTAAFFAVSVLVVNYHIFSEWLSLLVKTRSSQAVRRLLDLQPETARVQRLEGWVEIPTSEVQLDDIVRIRPGERVPVDGVVVEGRSAVDASLVTGEPMPVSVTNGDSVIGGSINSTGALLVRATAVGESTFLAQVVRSVEDARALKPGILHLVDRILRIYTPAVLGISLLSFIGWMTFSWSVYGSFDLERAIFAALSVLVMGYPCAVGIAAPLSIVRGAGEAADLGIVMRTGEAFQAMGQVRTIVLDKTGTLTKGHPTVRKVMANGSSSEEEVLRFAAAAEMTSEHPLGRSITEYALTQGIDIPDSTDFESITGIGVVAYVDGLKVVVGRSSELSAGSQGGVTIAQQMEDEEMSGATVVVVSVDDRFLGAVALGDELREDAIEALAEMRRRELVPVLLTGDNVRAAEWVAAEVGIDIFHAGILPGEKSAIVRDIQKSGRVAMVGDGINDAPALMQADVGIAMGAGTDIAMESADIILVNNQLMSVVRAMEISKRSYSKTRQNVALAFIFNGVGIPIAATGLLYPVWAMAAMALSVTSIFTNSLWGRPALLFQAVLSVGRKQADVATPKGLASNN